jgi:hypothetical protein
MADLLRAIIAKEEGKTIRIVRKKKEGIATS